MNATKNDDRTRDPFEEWMGRSEICQRLGITTRTLQRKVKRGEIERRQMGREAHFKMVSAQTDRVQNTQAGSVAVSASQDLASILETLTQNLVEARTQIALLEEKRDNAVEIGMRLSDQAEELSSNIEEGESRLTELTQELSKAEAALEEVRHERDDLQTEVSAQNREVGRLQIENERLKQQNRVLIKSLTQLQNGLQMVSESFLSLPIRKHLGVLLLATARAITSD